MTLLAGMRGSTSKKLLAVATAGALCVPLAILGGSAAAATHAKAPDAAKAPNVTVVMGTTDRIVSADPAGSYDLPSWTIIWNVYQTLVKYPPGSTKIVPDAATCAWKGSEATVYVCKLLPNQYFSNGDPVTGADVVYSFERINKIKDPNGPQSLISAMKGVTASGNTVTFTMKYPAATWPDVLTTGAGAIVDAKVFPFNKLQPDAKIVGSGPYELQTYTPNQLAVFVPNPHYGGNDAYSNNKFIIRYEESASTLVSDVEQGAVDIAYREMSPTDLLALKKASGVSVVFGKGIEIRYMGFNLRTMPGSSTAQKLAIRQAVSYLVNRQDIAANVYHGTVTPAYSIIPDALPGHINSFSTVYGASPNTAKAKAVLAAAGVKTPLKFALWYNTNHYLDTDLATELQRQLNGSGLFDVSLQTAEWSTYITAVTTNVYPIYLMGWFPDYPDADDYTGPFYGCTNFLVDHYCNASVTKDIIAEEGSTVASVRDAAFSALRDPDRQGRPADPTVAGRPVGGTAWQGDGPADHAGPVLHLPVLADRQELVAE